MDRQPPSRDITITRPAEFTPFKEAPSRTAVVRLPAVGQIRGTNVRMPLHTDPTLFLANYLQTVSNVSELSIEGRIVINDQRSELVRHPWYAFLNMTRLLTESSNPRKDSILYPREAGNTSIPSEEALRYLSDPFSPQTLADEIGYSVGFVPAQEVIDTLATRIGSMNSIFLRGCNEFRIGSDSLPQEKLDQLAESLGRQIVIEEAMAGEKTAGTYNTVGYVVEPLDPSFIT